MRFVTKPTLSKKSKVPPNVEGAQNKKTNKSRSNSQTSSIVSSSFSSTELTSIPSDIIIKSEKVTP